MDINSRFKVAFEDLGMSYDSFLKSINVELEKTPLKMSISKTRLTRMLSGKTFIPTSVLFYMCEKHGFNIEFFIEKSDDLYTPIVVLEDSCEDTTDIDSIDGKLWNKIINFFKN